MFSALKLLLVSLLGDAAGRVLSGAGLALTTGAVMVPVVSAGLDAVASASGGLGSDLAAVAAMGGVGVALGAIGSAILTRTMINAARVGLKKAVAK
ncbi:MAG: DUF2523 domain-containing protein [Xanthomonadales bacterium]|nr:DUF2523 domain-containing protein [Xanthomonadales bacterium]